MFYFGYMPYFILPNCSAVEVLGIFQFPANGAKTPIGHSQIIHNHLTFKLEAAAPFPTAQIQSAVRLPKRKTLAADE